MITYASNIFYVITGFTFYAIDMALEPVIFLFTVIISLQFYLILLGCEPVQGIRSSL